MCSQWSPSVLAAVALGTPRNSGSRCSLGRPRRPRCLQQWLVVLVEVALHARSSGSWCSVLAAVPLGAHDVLGAHSSVDNKYETLHQPLVSYTSCTVLIDKRASVESEHRERLGQWVHVTFSK